MRHNTFKPLSLLIGLFLLLPAVALASFPDFGPFETQTRYLEAGFGIAEQFFNQAAGIMRQGSQYVPATNKTLQYLCLTAALVGAALVVIQKKNQSLGTLIPWLVLVFIMIAGPYNSKLLFVDAKNASVAGGNLEALLPGYGTADSLTSTSQKGFTPQVLSIHVMSTLHRLFYDFFSERNIDNYISAMSAQSKASNVDSIKLSKITYDRLAEAEACSAVTPTSAATNPSSADSTIPPQSFSELLDELVTQGRNGIKAHGTEKLPIIALPTTLSQLPADYQQTYLNNINELAPNILPEGSYTLADPDNPSSLTTLVNQFFNPSVSKLYKGSSNVLPSSLGYYMAPMDSVATSAAAQSRAATDLSSDFWYFDEVKKDPLYSTMIEVFYNLPVHKASAQITNNTGNVSAAAASVQTEILDNCETIKSNAIEAALRDSLDNANVDPDMINLIAAAHSSGTALDKTALETFTQAGGNTAILANDYILNHAVTQKNDLSTATALFVKSILENAKKNYLPPSNISQNAYNTNVGGNASAAVNSVAKAFVGLAKPVIQLISPFILAFAIMVIEMMQVIIDICLMGIVIATPLAFIMGLIIPSYAMGIMTLATLCVLVLKMVPVTFTIVDAIISIMYKMLEANTASFAQMSAQDGFVSAILQKGIDVFLPSFEQTLLMFAAAGMYTSLVGISLFILFKIGDPSSVSQLAAIDGAAKQVADLPKKMAMAAAAALAGVGALGVANAMSDAKAGGAGGSDQTSGAAKAAKDVAAQEIAGKTLGEMSEEERDEFLRNKGNELKSRENELLADDGKALQDMMNSDETDEAMKSLLKQSYADGSGGLDFDQFGKNFARQKGALSNWARTTGAESKDIVSSAAASLAPGNASAAIKEVFNAKKEGQARTEARRGEAQKSKNAAAAELAAEQGLDFNEMSNLEQAQFIQSNDEKLDKAYDLSALSKADYNSQVEGYRGQFGSMIGGGEAYKSGGQALFRNAADQGKSQAGQILAQSQASYEMHGAAGLSSRDYEIASSLQARQAAADIKQASVDNLKIAADGIQAKAERASHDTVNAYEQQRMATESFNKQIASNVLSGNMSNEERMAKIKSDPAMNARFEELRNGASTDAIKETFIQQKMLDFKTQNPKATNAAIDKEYAAVLEGVAQNDSGAFISDNKYTRELSGVIDASVRDSVVAEFALKDGIAVMNGGTAKHFNVTDDMRNNINSADFMASQRATRRAGGNQYKADDLSTSEYFMSGYDRKYKQGKISLADHHISASIEKDADGASSLKSNANAIRRMGDMQWEHHNKLKEIEMETQFRGRIASGMMQSASARTSVIVEQEFEKAGDLNDREIQIKSRNNKFVRDAQGRVSRVGDVISEAEIRDASRKQEIKISKAQSHAGGVIADTTVKEHTGVTMQHENPAQDTGGIIEKYYRAHGKSLVEARQEAEAVHVYLQRAALKVNKKAYAKHEVTDNETGVTMYMSKVNVGHIEAGIKQYEAEGQKQEAQQMRKYLGIIKNTAAADKNKYVTSKDAIYHEVGASLTEGTHRSRVKEDANYAAKIKKLEESGNLKSVGTANAMKKAWSTLGEQNAREGNS